MPGKFEFRSFADIDISDSFFDSLKTDYPADNKNIGFVNWFAKKSREGAQALVFYDEEGLGAFVCLKDEDELIELNEGILPAIPRKKISTLRLAERFRGQRLGEGAIGLSLWDWQKSRCKEIYLTVFDRHGVLIEQLERFGFYLAGHNSNGECVYIKSRDHIDYSDPYRSFPFIKPTFEKAGYLIVDDDYHDTLFPYSELKNTIQEQLQISAANGISKVYIGSPRRPHYGIGEPILIYRKYTKQDGQRPRYKSCLTSYGIVTNITYVKKYGRGLILYDQFRIMVSNKSVFSETELQLMYESEPNLVVIELLYYGFFGEGHNVNYAWLVDNGYFLQGVYPTENRATPSQFKEILEEGDVDVSNVIID